MVADVGRPSLLESAVMETSARRFSDDDLRRIIGLADRYQNERGDLSEADIQEIGLALGISSASIGKAIERSRRTSSMGKSSATWQLVRQGLFVANGRAPGFTGRLRSRLAMLGVVGVAFAAIAGAFVRQMSPGVLFWVTVVFSILFGYPAWRLANQALTRSFLIALPDRLVALRQPRIGQVSAWDRRLRSVQLEIAPVFDNEGGWEVAQLYQIVYRDGDGGRFSNFAGLDTDELQAILEGFEQWRGSGVVVPDA